MLVQMPISGTIQTYDLAQSLKGERGTFFVQQGNQGYFAVCAAGHSLKSLIPVGKSFPNGNTVPTTLGAEPWTVQKISNDEITLLSGEETTTSSRR